MKTTRVNVPIESITEIRRKLAEFDKVTQRARRSLLGRLAQSEQMEFKERNIARKHGGKAKRSS